MSEQSKRIASSGAESDTGRSERLKKIKQAKAFRDEIGRLATIVGNGGLKGAMYSLNDGRIEVLSNSGRSHVRVWGLPVRSVDPIGNKVSSTTVIEYDSGTPDAPISGPPEDNGWEGWFNESAAADNTSPRDPYKPLIEMRYMQITDISVGGEGFRYTAELLFGEVPLGSGQARSADRGGLGAPLLPRMEYDDNAHNRLMERLTGIGPLLENAQSPEYFKTGWLL